mmetsp:Transcript_50046/g.108721  ORF Transcript_50046/g.108721 Transcript_50046/m.108721 type:complete len:245 (-) Transcript_50046:173-907(-)
MTSSSSRLSSMAFMRESSASRPKASLGSLTRVYASSTKSTPPKARSTTASVLGAVSPRCSPTRSAREHSTNCPLGRTLRLRSISPMSRAMVVLPVPGFPVKSMWRAAMGGTGRSIALFSLAMVIWALSPLTNCFTGATPTTLSKRSAMLSPAAAGAATAAKSSSMIVNNEFSRIVPLSATRSVCALSTLSTRFRTARALPLAATERGSAVCSSCCSLASVMSGWSLSFCAATIVLNISVSSGTE